MSPKNKTRRVEAKITQPHNDLTAYEESFEGPLPHPSILKGYEVVLPGSADRIIKMTEA